MSAWLDTQNQRSCLSFTLVASTAFQKTAESVLSVAWGNYALAMMDYIA